MATSPNVDNYTLGKGKIYFNRKLPDGSYEGERALGNAPEFNYSMSIDKLDHYSSMAGIRTKDATVVTELTANVSFILDEITSDNLELLFFGSTTTIAQTADDQNIDSFSDTDAVACVWLPLASKKVGVFTMTVSAVSGTFQTVEVINGGTTSSDATIRKIDGNTLTISGITADFQVGEEITGGTSAATATVVSINTFSNLDVVVHDGAYTTFYTLGTDYSIDASSGRLHVEDGSALIGNAFAVTYAREAVTYKQVNAITTTAVEGALRFVSDNPRGNQNEIEIWRVDLTTDGDTAFVGEDWAQMSFTGEILKDPSNHPAQPYFIMNMYE